MATSKEENTGKKFVWKIENYDCIKENVLVSPSFTSNDALWELHIFPNGNSTEGYIAIHVKYLNCPNDFKAKHLKCSVSFLNSEGSPLIWKERKVYVCPNGTNSYYGSFEDFIANQEISGSRKSLFLLLPNNVLTIQCCIWKSREELLSHTTDIFVTHIEPRHVELIEKSFTLHFENVTSSAERRKHVLKMANSGVSLTLEGYWTEDQLKGMIILSFHNYLIKCSVSLLDTTGRAFEFATWMHHFKNNGEVWNFGTNITKDMLICHKSRFLHGDTLTVKFAITLSDDLAYSRRIDKPLTFDKNNGTDDLASSGTINKPLTLGKNNAMVSFESAICTGESEKIHPSSRAILQDLKGMYEEGLLSDFSLRVGEKTFPVHKAILGARSPVFRSMFTTEMKEKQNNCVEIEDVDVDTLQRMLLFVYTDRVDKEMGWEAASSLYTVADKYALEPLKQDCSAILKSGLCNEGVLDILSLANMHEDQDLKSAALDFISRNDKEIVGSDRWVRFEEENAQLALDTFRKLYFKKMHG